MNIKAIIVEDEEEGMRALEIKVTKFCPEIKIIEKCYTVKEAVKAIDTMNPDLIFLDVRLDQDTGFDVLQKVKQINFEIIFTTGYDEYAVRAMNEGALYYLLKPIDTDELQTAVGKAKRKLERLKKQKRVMIPTSEGIKIVPIKDIIYCEAYDNFAKVYAYIEGKDDRGKSDKNQPKMIMSPRTLKVIEAMLPSIQFYRIHRSFLINLCFVQEYRRAAGGSVVLKNGKELSIARGKGDEMMHRLQESIHLCDD